MIRRKTNPPKEEKQKPEKQKPAALKPKKREAAAPVIAPPVVALPTPTEKVKKDWDKISVSGTHPDVTAFKGLVKYRGKVVGEVILGMIRAWNEANKITTEKP